MSNAGMVRELIVLHIGGYKDNLYRARHAAAQMDSSKQYGQSGQTLDEIIAGYEEPMQKWEAILEWYDNKVKDGNP